MAAPNILCWLMNGKKEEAEVPKAVLAYKYGKEKVLISCAVSSPLETPIHWASVWGGANS